MLLDFLCNLPRLRMSSAQIKAVIFVLKEAGVENVPSYDTLRKIQKKLNKKISVPTQRNVSDTGNVYYSNDLASQIARDLANHTIRPLIQVYPEATEGVVGETWNAKKWCQEVDGDALTPMAIGAHGQHFYVNELAKCVDETLIIPLRWIKRRGELTCDALLVLRVRFLFFGRGEAHTEQN